MIRYALLFSLMLLMACSSCATTSAYAMHAQVTGISMIEKCNDPVEVHNVPPFKFPIPAQLSRHHDCLGVDDMLVVLWPLSPTEVNIAAAELLMLMYVEHQNEESVNTVISTTFIKQDSFEYNGKTLQAIFYEIVETPREKLE